MTTARNLFDEAIILATSGEYKSCSQVQTELYRRGMPTATELAAFEKRRAYIGELCAKNYGRRSHNG